MLRVSILDPTMPIFSPIGSKLCYPILRGKNKSQENIAIIHKILRFFFSLSVLAKYYVAYYSIYMVPFQ